MLSTAILCHYHSSNIKMRDMLLRHLGAFQNASRTLEHYYQELTPSGPSAQCNLTYPYPMSFTSGSMGHTVKYLSELASEHNFVFFGDLDSTAARRKLCIKFTHQYNEDVYRYCAAKGHAPKLHVVQCLPGGSFYSSSGLGPNPATHRDRKLEGMARFALGFAWCEGTALHGLLVLAPL